MSAISTYLEYIRSKIYAKDVRTAIVNAISQCYDDVNKPALQTEAMQRAVQAKIDAGQMAALTIADGSLTGAKLANGTIPTAKIADGAITTAKIADGAVTGAKVGTGTLTGDNIANKAIGTAKIDDGAVTWQKLASGAVHTGELADGAVTGVKLADSSVSEGKLASSAVTTTKLADGAVTAGKIASGVVPAVDATLAQTGAAADAKAVGDEIADLKSDLSETENEIIRTAGVVEELECGLTEEVEAALLACFAHVAWISDDGQTYYDALSNALNRSRVLSSIRAVFTQGSAVIYDTDELYALKQYLTVTAIYDGGTTKEVNNYTLNGELVPGNSTITVAYNKKTTTFNVNVTHQAKTLESISATFNSSASITTDNALDDLRPYLTVRASYSDGSTNTITNYALSGSLNVGANTITVTYSGKTDTFDVNVTEVQTTLQSISANYSGKQLILSGESVEKLRNGLTVTAHYSDGTDTTVTNYTLSGTLAAGTNNIGVAYKGKETTFNISIPASHYLTASDIESNYGINLSIDSTGTPTHTSTGEVYFGILFKPSVTKIKCTITEWLDQSHFTLLVNKAGNNVYGIDPGTVNQYVPTERDKFTVASGNAGYTKEADYTTTVIQDFYPVHDWPSILIPRKDTEIVMELTNGKVTITDIQGNTICYVNATNANRLGYWGSFYLIGPYFTNIIVIGS